MGDGVFEVILDGGGPWGFRLQGGKDFGIPLNIARITPGSKANLKNLQPADQIIEINGTKVEELTHMEAQNLIKNAGSRLQLRLKPAKAHGSLAANPRILTQNVTTHSAGVDHQFNAKPKAFTPAPSGGSSIRISMSPSSNVSTESKGAPAPVQAPKFDPSAYAKKKKEELDKLKEKKKETVVDSDILKMINQTSIDEGPGQSFPGSGGGPENGQQGAFRMVYSGSDIHEEVNPGSNVIDSLKAKVKEDKAGLHSESKVPSRVFQMLQKQYDDDDENAEDLPPPPPELIDDDANYGRASFGNTGPGQQSKTFRMLQDSVNTGETHESVFSRAPEDRNKAVPMPVQHKPQTYQPTTVYPIPKAPMPQGPNFKISSPKAPSIKAFPTASSPAKPTVSSTWKPPGAPSPPPPAPPTYNAPASPSAPSSYKPPSSPSYTSYSPSNAQSNGFSGSSPPVQPQQAIQKIVQKTSPSPIGVVDSNRLPTCYGCNDLIRGPFVSAIGKTWHSEHFCCAACNKSLQNQGFVEENGKLYCEKCFNDFFAPKCAACGNSIIGNCVNALGKTFHPEHFVCKTCGKSFSGEGFLIEGGFPYCENCYDHTFSVKCGRCNKSITGGDRYVEALNKNWHTECFSCSVCNQKLEGTSFYVVGGRPLCALHKSG